MSYSRIGADAPTQSTGDKVLDVTKTAINAIGSIFGKAPTYTPMDPAYTQTQSTFPTTLLLLGGGVALFFLLRRK